MTAGLFLRAVVAEVGRLILVLLFALCLQSQAAAQEFRQSDDGSVHFAGKQYSDLSAYVRSPEFQQGGMRCGSDRRAATQAEQRASLGLAELQPKSTADCTLGLTQIQQEYSPDGLHYSVPLWFHVIHRDNGTGNISDQAIADQIAVLNEDFRALAGTMGAPGFDVKVEFTLAGVDRIQNNDWFTGNSSWDPVYKAALAKDPSLFTNVYTNNADGYLGYAYYPQGTAGSSLDGITMLYAVIGGRNNGAFGGLYDQGRTLVHELGHYLALAHVFSASGGGACGNTYSSGDLITDTNAQSGQVFGCPVSSSSCGSSDPLDNYMGYVDDDCMDAFTAEQGNRAVCALLNYRPNLFTVVFPDADGDGVPDSEDDFPNNPSESSDSDGDGVGDNADAFPFDPTETTDTDGDGLGDNREAELGTNPAVIDSDGDSFSDGDEVDAGSDPLDSNDQPVAPGLSLVLIKALIDAKAGP